jgi:hypothetical protein
MDKLEEYLEQVCRRIGGPKAMRRHIRQELQEHLRDAAAQHQAAGMSAEAALAQAMADFGKPEEVRSELEEAHGHRLLAVAIDKAIEWKEMTMKAKWLWTSWAHLALVAVIALAIFWIVFASVFIVPKITRLMQDGMIDSAVIHDASADWTVSFPLELGRASRHSVWLILGAAVAWGLFEWRVRSENKSFMRLSILGTVAIAFVTVAVVLATSLAISFCLGAPATRQAMRPLIEDKVARLDSSILAVEEEVEKKEELDWDFLQKKADQANAEVTFLANSRFALATLQGPGFTPTVDEMQTLLKTWQENMLEASKAIREKNVGRLKSALAKFRASYIALGEAAIKAHLGQAQKKG